MSTTSTIHILKRSMISSSTSTKIKWKRTQWKTRTSMVWRRTRKVTQRRLFAAVKKCQRSLALGNQKHQTLTKVIGVKRRSSKLKEPFWSSRTPRGWPCMTIVVTSHTATWLLPTLMPNLSLISTIWTSIRAGQAYTLSIDVLSPLKSLPLIEAVYARPQAWEAPPPIL